MLYIYILYKIKNFYFIIKLKKKQNETKYEEETDFSYMELFYKKYNKVLLDKILMTNKKNFLNEENARLKAILKQYLDGISVNAEILEQANPLLVVNGKI